MPQFAVHRPLNERHLHYDLRLHPVCANPWKPGGFCKSRLRNLELIEASSQVQEKFCIEACSDLSGKDEVVTVEVTDEESSKSHSAALRICKSAHHELLRGFALHFQPVRRASMFVRGGAKLRYHAFPPFAACALPRFLVGKFRDTGQRCAQRQVPE